MTTATRRLTAEEYARLPETGVPTELVRGEVIELNVPNPRHGEICINFGYVLKEYLQQNPLGRVAGADGGIITERNPDTVRGADVWFISYNKVPRQPLPSYYMDQAPEIVFEITSPSDRRGRILTKVGEYLDAGVAVVCVLNPESETAHLFSPDADDQILQADDELRFPDILPGFKVRVGTLFE
jgi:Uma2 family endonuclease